jgi:hypothetical protein
MIEIYNASVQITTANVYEEKEETYRLNAVIESDSREFLERVSQAIHLELSRPNIPGDWAAAVAGQKAMDKKLENLKT